MNSKIWIILCITVLLITCSNKAAKNIGTATTEAKVENKASAAIKKTMYVNSKEGLRVRDKPDITGIVIGGLKYKNEVTVIEKTEYRVSIDDIRDYWYLVNSGDITGWVFGGYLRDSLEVIKMTEQRYFVTNVDVIMNTYSKYNEEYKEINENLIGRDDVSIEIKQEGDKRLALTCKIPFENRREPIKVQFDYPLDYEVKTDCYSPENGRLLYFDAGGKTGSDFEEYFYYNKGKIIFEYHHLQSNLYEKDGELYSSGEDEIQFRITFSQKGES